MAINTKQLCILLRKGKSSINNGFEAIGYNRIFGDAKIASALVGAFQFMKSDLAETRQWTIRELPSPDQLEFLDFADLTGNRNDTS
jgi:hypothetical protein